MRKLKQKLELNVRQKLKCKLKRKLELTELRLAYLINPSVLLQ